MSIQFPSFNISWGAWKIAHIWQTKGKAFLMKIFIFWFRVCKVFRSQLTTLQWRHNERDGVSNHQPHDCLLNCLFRRRWKNTSKLCVTGLCAGPSPKTGEFPTQKASNAENVIGWRHHEKDRNGLVPFRWQAISRTNSQEVLQHRMASLGRLGDVDNQAKQGETAVI